MEKTKYFKSIPDQEYVFKNFFTTEQEFRKQTEEAKFKAFASVSKKVAELEQENAELKLKLEALDGQTPWKDIKDKSKVIGKLTKAKELLKTYKDFIEYEGLSTRLGKTYDRTVQFLKDIE